MDVSCNSPELLVTLAVNCKLLAPATFEPVPLVEGFGVALELEVGVGVAEELVPLFPRVAK